MTKAAFFFHSGFLDIDPILVRIVDYNPSGAFHDDIWWEPLKTSLRWFLEFPTLFFYLKEVVLSLSYRLFFASSSFITKFCVSLTFFPLGF
jgi:hypothetical protein